MILNEPVFLAASLIGVFALFSLLVHYTGRWAGWVVATIVLTFVFIPVQAEGRFTPVLHPGAYLGAIFIAHALVTGRHDARNILRRSWPVWVALCGLSAYATLDLVNPFGGTAYDTAFTLIKLLWAPAVIYLCVRVVTARAEAHQRVIIGSLVIAGLVQVWLANQQVTTKGRAGYWWRSAYAENSWWWNDEFSLGLGTTGHTLQLGLFLAALVPLLFTLRAAWLRFTLAGAFIYGTTLATARASLVLSVGAVIVLLLQSARRWFATAIGIALLAPFVGWFLASEGFRSTQQKFEADGGSAQLRRDAFTWAVQNRSDFMWFGYPGGRDLRGQGLLGSSLENGYLMAGLQFGLVFAGALLVFHLSAILIPLRNGMDGTRVALALSCLVTWVGFFGSSSFMTGALESWTWWVFLGLLYGVVDRGKSPPLPSPVLAETETPRAVATHV